MLAWAVCRGSRAVLQGAAVVREGGEGCAWMDGVPDVVAVERGDAAAAVGAGAGM